MVATRVFRNFKELLDVNWASTPDGQVIKRSGLNLLGTDAPFLHTLYQRGYGFEVWVSPRTDGAGGANGQTGLAGTADDPFNGSTQALFDAVMTSWATVANTVIHVAAGNFNSNGAGGNIDTGWKAADGVQIIGAGIGATIITQQRILDNSAQNRGANGLIVGGYNCRVENLTLYCNYAALHAAHPGYAHSSNFGVQLKSGLMRNLRVTGPGGTGDVEVFACFFTVVGSATQPDQVMCDNVTVDNVEGDNVTAIAAAMALTVFPFTDSTPAAGTAIFQNCFVNGNGNLTSGQAFNIGGFKHAKIVNCTSKNTFYGFFHDTLPLSDLAIIDYSASCQGSAVQLVGSFAIDGVLIACNNLSSTTDVANLINTPSATRVKIIHNTLTPGGSFWTPIQTKNDATTNDIYDNLIDTGAGNTSASTLVGRFRNNRFKNGAVISWLADNLEIRIKAVAFASAPASPSEGTLQPFTDSTTATWGATITGGGTNHVLGYYNGTNWTVAGK